MRLSLPAALLLALAAAPVSSQTAPPATTTPPRTILFVGNSFTFGAHSAVKRYRPDLVTDLLGTGLGGVPALFKMFTQEAGLNYAVSMETHRGVKLKFHYDERRALIDKPWDVVVLQELSTFDRTRPGDPSDYNRYVPLLTGVVKKANPNARIELMATWSRADQTYLDTGHWHGQPIAKMALDIRAAADHVAAIDPNVTGILPVGQAWNRAFASGLADSNPYDGIDYGKIDLWTYDQFHGSIHGYYLEALIVFGRITGVDPLTLGKTERAADDLGIEQGITVRLQQVAHDELEAEKHLTSPNIETIRGSPAVQATP